MNIKREHIPHIFTGVRIVSTLIILFFAWTNAHWSVALYITLSAIAFESLAVTLQLHAKHIKAHKKGMKAAMQSFDEKVAEFNQFVATINNQAVRVKKEMNTCRECEQYPGSIRPGSIHNSAADNCQMHRQQPVYAPSSSIKGPMTPSTPPRS